VHEIPPAGRPVTLFSMVLVGTGASLTGIALGSILQMALVRSGSTLGNEIGAPPTALRQALSLSPFVAAIIALTLASLGTADALAGQFVLALFMSTAGALTLTAALLLRLAALGPIVATRRRYHLFVVARRPLVTMYDPWVHAVVDPGCRSGTERIRRPRWHIVRSGFRRQPRFRARSSPGISHLLAGVFAGPKVAMQLS
jgi:hypothetical protein